MEASIQKYSVRLGTSKYQSGQRMTRMPRTYGFSTLSKIPTRRRTCPRPCRTKSARCWTNWPPTRARPWPRTTQILTQTVTRRYTAGHGGLGCEAQTGEAPVRPESFHTKESTKLSSVMHRNKVKTVNRYAAFLECLAFELRQARANSGINPVRFIFLLRRFLYVTFNIAFCVKEIHYF